MHRFPPLADPSALPRRVLVIAPHPDDEVFGCGGMLALHADLGAEVRVVILSDGAVGDTETRRSHIAATRRAESLAARDALGLPRSTEVRFLGLPDGALEAQQDLAARIEAELEAFAPALVYAPSPQEYHADHRAAFRASAAALARGPARAVHLYGVNEHVAANVLYDITGVHRRKRAAVQCFESQLALMDLVAKSEAFDRARTVNIDMKEVEFAEGFASLSSEALGSYGRAAESYLGAVHAGPAAAAAPSDPLAATAVLSTWNKRDVVRENLLSLGAQTRPFAKIVVVDNASKDGTAEMVAAEFPEVTLVVMPHSRYGACETFNIGFACATTPLVAILDDDVTLPPTWLEATRARLTSEPATTAIVSTEVIEPGMPASYLAASKAQGRRYMSTFRGCGSLARRDALAKAGYYDERLFIYGNERDLTCRLLNLGYRVLQDPEIETFHKTPFGIQMGKRSLYYHARNAWLTMLKYAPARDLLRLPWLVVTKVLLRGERKEAEGAATDATGTIGIGRAIRETPGAGWILVKASLSVLANVPHCLRNRRPCRAQDFELPIS